MSLLKKLAVSTIDGKHFLPSMFQLNTSDGQLRGQSLASPFK